MSPRISNWTRLMVTKKNVACKRVNQERHRHLLAQAVFVSVPRLITASGPKLPLSVKKG
jgi:hypothetical protein